MSLCLYIQNDDRIIVGADTAVTFKINGEMYRHPAGYEKLTKIDNFLLFVCGELILAKRIISDFEQQKVKTAEDMQRIISHRYEQFITEQPEKLNDLVGDYSLFSMVAFECRKHGKMASYIFNYTDGFTPVKQEASRTESLTNTAGFSSEKALEIALDLLYKKGVRDTAAVYREVFEKMAGCDIGGALVLYRVDKNGIRLLKKEPIHEVLRAKKLETQLASGMILIGASIKTATSARRVQMDADQAWVDVFGDTTHDLRIHSVSNFVEIYSPAGKSINLGTPGAFTLPRGSWDFANALVTSIPISGVTALQGTLDSKLSTSSNAYLKSIASQAIELQWLNNYLEVWVNGSFKGYLPISATP